MPFYVIYKHKHEIQEKQETSEMMMANRSVITPQYLHRRTVLSALAHYTTTTSLITPCNTATSQLYFLIANSITHLGNSHIGVAASMQRQQPQQHRKNTNKLAANQKDITHSKAVWWHFLSILKIPYRRERVWNVSTRDTSEELIKSSKTASNNSSKHFLKAAVYRQCQLTHRSV